jgi:hypothetical protein
LSGEDSDLDAIGVEDGVAAVAVVERRAADLKAALRGPQGHATRPDLDLERRRTAAVRGEFEDNSFRR